MSLGRLQILTSDPCGPGLFLPRNERTPGPDRLHAASQND